MTLLVLIGLVTGLTGIARAQPGPEVFPRMAEVLDLPASGVVRVHVPLDLRTPADPSDATDLMLLNAAGEAVPVLRLAGPPEWSRSASLAPEPLPEPLGYRVDVGRLPVDGLSFTLPSQAAVRVAVRTPGGEELAPATWLWRLDQARHEDLILTRPAAGELEVHLDGPRASRFRRMSLPILGLRLREPGVPDEVVSLTPVATVLQENDWQLIDVPLERPMPIRAVRIHAADDVFERAAGVVSVPWEARVLDPHAAQWPGDTAPIRKVELGGTTARSTEVPVMRALERVGVLVEAEGKPPLDITGVDVLADGVQLVARDPGPGPHTLYGGAPAGTALAYDLAVAASELLALSDRLVEPGPVVANPAWVPPEVRANLVAPSTKLDLAGFRLAREVEGPPGPVRIPIPPEVQIEAQGGLKDVRLAVGGHKLPHLVRRSIGDSVLEGVSWQREEQGATSRILVSLPLDGLAVASVRLTTPATVFERQVRVEAARGADLDVVRAATWRAADRPGQLSLALGRPLGAGFAVAIDNGDDPPLPIDGVEVRVGTWEVVTVLPEEGRATLFYGDRRRHAPDYDLALLAEELRPRALAVATLGEPQAQGRRALTLLDRAILAVGLLVLAVGLVGLIVDLVRRTPAPSPGAG